jgi:hypothetical protein
MGLQTFGCRVHSAFPVRQVIRFDAELRSVGTVDDRSLQLRIGLENALHDILQGGSELIFGVLDLVPGLVYDHRRLTVTGIDDFAFAERLR